MSGIRKHLTYSNVMVTVLAFVVLGGTAWAVAKNSVTAGTAPTKRTASMARSSGRLDHKDFPTQTGNLLVCSASRSSTTVRMAGYPLSPVIAMLSVMGF